MPIQAYLAVVVLIFSPCLSILADIIAFIGVLVCGRLHVIHAKVIGVERVKGIVGSPLFDKNTSALCRFIGIGSLNADDCAIAP